MWQRFEPPARGGRQYAGEASQTSQGGAAFLLGMPYGKGKHEKQSY